MSLRFFGRIGIHIDLITVWKFCNGALVRINALQCLQGQVMLASVSLE